MKKTFLILAVLLCGCFALKAQQNYDFSADCSTGQTLYFRIIDAEQNFVSIVAPNSDDLYHCWDNFTKPTGNIKLPATVEHNRTSYTVTEINSFAFYGCNGLTGSLSIPNSVTSIGNYAFERCSGFTGSLTIPNSVTSIGKCVFEYCENFTGPLTIGNSVTSIGDYTFYRCYGLTGSLIIPNSVTSIGEFAFRGCSKLTGSLTIPNSVTSIGLCAFNGCSGFTGSLTIGNAVGSIGYGAFFDCSGFTQIIAKPFTPPTLGTPEPGFGDDVFNGMTNLQSILVPCNYGDTYKENEDWSPWTDMIEEGFVYDLTLASSNAELGTASITQYPDCTNPSATVTATPTGINTFTGWTENGVVVSTDNPYTFTQESDRNLVANFTGYTYVYGPIMSLPSPIDPNAVYHLGYQVGNDYYLHTSGTAAGQMQLSENPENPVEYKIHSMQYGTGTIIFAFANNYGSSGNNYLHIDTQGVSYGTFNPMNSPTDPFSLSIVDGNISSAAASDYTVCHNDDNIITVHTRTSGGNLRFFSNRIIKPLYHIAVSATPEGAGTATATMGGVPVESAAEGTEITVTAEPVDGYKFVNWTENGVEVSTTTPYTFTLTNDRNLVANFTTTDQYDFTAICATGQKLYYRIIDADRNFVSIVAPGDDDYWGWDNFTRPTGPIELPETVTDNRATYTVTAIGNFAFCHCDGLTGSLTIPNSVTSIGNDAFYDCSGFTGSLTIGSSVESIGGGAFEDCSGFTGSLTIPNNVISIGGGAFYNCSGLNDSLTIGNSVRSIGEEAFRDCSNLTGSLTIPNSVTSIGDYAFFECSGFTGSLTIGSSVESIGRDAFQWCSGFTGSLTIPNSVTSIGDYAFIGCSGFTGSLTISSSVESIGSSAFQWCSGFTGSLTIPISVTSIGDYAFFGCSSFSNIIAKPATPPDLGVHAFDGMSGLLSITVPCNKDGDYKTKTGWSSFASKIDDGIVYDLTVASANTAFGSASISQQPDCNTQAEITATPNNGYRFVNWTENGVQVSTENQYSFTLESDRNLVANFGMQYDFSATCPTGQTLYYRIIDAEQHWVSIVPPNSDNANGWYGFDKPTGDIMLPETVEHDRASYTVTEINSYAFNNCNGLTGSLDIPNSVTSIGEYAFFSCSGFTGSLTIPNSVNSIGIYAFIHCYGFTGSLTIPNSITRIEESAFCDCSGFTGTLTIPNFVTSIGNLAFERCSGITHIIAKPATPPDLGNYAFDAMTKLETITVPCFTDEDYKNAIGWRSFTSKIEDGIVHDLTVESANPAFGSASITQQATCENHQVTLTATPNDGYKFVNWTENGVQVSTENQYSFTLESDRNLVANFAVRQTYHITVSATPEGAGTATATAGGEQVESAFEGTRITVSATPAVCYRFVNWTENGEQVSTDKSFTFTLESDRNLVANFFKQYDFSAICETGQTLYYRIIDAEQNFVSIVAPNSDYNWDCYEGYARPTGDISLPANVSLNETSYTVKKIGDCAFCDCDGLTGSISIPNSVTSIGNDAFAYCWGFTGSLTIPNSVTSIGEAAFVGASFTGTLTIPNSITRIEEWAFSGTGFTDPLIIPNSVTSIGEYAFHWCVFTGSLVIPNSVESIEGSAFSMCLRLNGSLIIPNSVTSIGRYAFYGSDGLNGMLVIPDNVTTIEEGTFWDCTGFTGLTIGESVENIDKKAFNNCNFDNIISKAQTPPSIGSYIHDASKNVYVPVGKAGSYEVAWNTGLSEEDKYNFIESDGSTCRFVGTSSNAWSNASNWENGEIATESTPNTFIDADCELDVEASVGSVTVAAGKTLTVNTGKMLTADGIILEEGAQLINNGTVTSNDLSMRKSIAGYGTSTGNWNLVSSPVATTSLPVGMQTVPEEGPEDIQTYDLYRFDQTGDSQGREWLNYRAESFGIENQSGYLYASKNGTTIIFRGNFAATETKELEYVEGVDFPGFNLVGNPYPCNATISGTNLRSSNYFYKMNEGGTDLEVVANPIIAPCTGVFAVAANDQATVTFTQTSDAANVTRGEKSALRDIRVELLANGKVIDRAFLNMNGESLPKFRLQDNNSEICFYQDKEELAVASTDAARGEMPLNFKAAKNGSYTITVNAENADLDYLHLVDNLTGNDVDLLATEGDVPWRVSTYTFDAKTSDYASRFKLVFGVKDDTSAGSVSESFAYISNGEIVISNEGRATLQVIDVLGRIISSEEINGDCRISTNTLTAGLYILNLNGLTQKIVVE